MKPTSFNILEHRLTRACQYIREQGDWAKASRVAVRWLKWVERRIGA